MTERQYVAARRKIDEYERLRGGRTSLSPQDLRGFPKVTNEERSRVEVYEFMHNRPSNYFAYIKARKMVTWMGDVLGDVDFGAPFRSNMGDTRVPIRVNAVNGLTYAGTYFKSAGDYCRIRATACVCPRK